MNTWRDIRSRVANAGIDGGGYLDESEITALDNEIDLLVSRIRECSDLPAAEALLAELGSLQEFLALMLFKYRAPLTWKQRGLVRRFDRSDDSDQRAVVFADIQDGQFP